MKGLRRRIEEIIEDVNLEIRVDLGLEQVTPEELARLKEPINLSNELLEIEPEDEEESEEAIAFEKVLDEIEARYKVTEIEEESDIFELDTDATEVFETPEIVTV